MALYTITLREIIYQKTQDQNPLANIQGLNTAKSVDAYRPENYIPGDGGRYPFFYQQNYPTIEERIAAAQNQILAKNLLFQSEEFKTNFWNAFCVTFLMREIEFETTGLFILKLNQRLRTVLPRYNILWNAIHEDLEPFISYREMTDRGLNENIDRNNTGNSNINNSSNSKNVFEDTPQNKLGNPDYATNITTVDSGYNTGNTYKDDTNTDRNLSEGIIKQGFNRPKIELIGELFEKLQDLIDNMVHDVGDQLFLKVFN